MYTVEGLDRDFPRTIDLLGYYISLEHHLSKQYRLMKDLADDKFAKQLLSLMSKSSKTNALILRATFDELSRQGLVEQPTIILAGWSNVSPSRSGNRHDSNDLQESLRKYLAFEEYLKMEYRTFAEYLIEATQKVGVTLDRLLLSVAENHEEYYHILKNLLKISTIEKTLAKINS